MLLRKFIPSIACQVAALTGAYRYMFEGRTNSLIVELNPLTVIKFRLLVDFSDLSILILLSILTDPDEAEIMPSVQSTAMT